MCPACATVVLTIAGVSYAVNKLRKQNNRTEDETSQPATSSSPGVEPR
jgi:hypothetical protein